MTQNFFAKTASAICAYQHALQSFVFVFLLMMSLAAAIAATSQKVDIRGDEASYSSDGKRAEFSGNVVLTFDGSVIRANQLLVEIRKGGNRYTASGTPVQALCNGCGAQPIRFAANTIILQDGDAQVIRIFGEIEMCAGKESECAKGKVSAESVRWQQSSDTAALLGAPAIGYWMLPSGERADFRAGKIKYNGKTGDIMMQNDARLARGDNEITGKEISFNFKTGALSAEGGDDGRVRGVFGGDE